MEIEEIRDKVKGKRDKESDYLKLVSLLYLVSISDCHKSTYDPNGFR